jgi:hypothetical protein
MVAPLSFLRVGTYREARMAAALAALRRNRRDRDRRIDRATDVGAKIVSRR